MYYSTTGYLGSLEATTCLLYYWSKIQICPILTPTLTDLSEKYQICPKHIRSVRNVRKISDLSKTYQICPNNIRSVRKISDLSGKYQICPNNIRSVRTISDLSETYQICPKHIRSVRTISDLSEPYHFCLWTFQNCPKISVSCGSLQL